MDEAEISGREEEVFYDDGLEYEMDSVWLACAIDSEGSIGLHYQGRKHSNSLSPIVEITNTDYSFIDNVSRITNEKVHDITQVCNSRSVYRVRIIALNKILFVLDRVIPYFVTKKRHAELLIEFCAGRLKLSGKLERRWSEVILSKEREVEIYEELKELNRRGVK